MNPSVAHGVLEMHGLNRTIQGRKNRACTGQVGRGLVSSFDLFHGVFSSFRALSHVVLTKPMQEKNALQKADRLITYDGGLEHLQCMAGKDIYVSVTWCSFLIRDAFYFLKGR